MKSCNPRATRPDLVCPFFVDRHVGLGETTMRQYNECGDNLSVLSPHAGPPCIAAFLFFFEKRAAQLVLQMLDLLKLLF